MKVGMSVSYTGLLIPGETPLTAHCIGGWIGPQNRSDALERRKVFGCEILFIYLKYIPWIFRELYLPQISELS